MDEVTVWLEKRKHFSCGSIQILFKVKHIDGDLSNFDKRADVVAVFEENRASRKPCGEIRFSVSQ